MNTTQHTMFSRKLPVTCYSILFLLAAVFSIHSAAAQALQIDSAGNVGIGTNKPGNRLTVAGKSNFTDNVAIGTTVSTALRLAVSGNVKLGIVDNSAVGIDEGVNARLGFIKKNGTYPHISSATGTPIIFSQTDQTDIFTNISGATLSERMRIDANGNVGINHSTPGYKLTIGGTGDVFGVDNSAIFSAKNAAGAYEQYLWPRWSDNVMYMNYGSNGLNLRNNASVSALFIKGDRNVGIGTTTPSSALTVKGNGIGGTIRVLPSADNGESGVAFFQKADGSGKQWVISQGGWSNTGKLIFGYEGDGPRMTIQQNGYVGIGTSDPQTPLHVNGFVNRNLVNFYFMFQNESRKVANSSPHANSISILASNGIEAGAFYAMSDMRIKKDLALSDNNDDLNTVKQLEVTRYHYMDEIQNGSGYKTGFVAQQVEKVFPQAIHMRNGFIPNIFMQADTTVLSQENMVVTMKEPHRLVTGDNVRLITATGETLDVSVTVPGPKTFTVPDWARPAEKIFVYGKKTDDVRSVDYQQLFSLGIGAIQQLSRQNDELVSENQVLKTTLEKLVLQMKALEEKVNTLATKKE